jgi:hypothetical protein
MTQPNFTYYRDIFIRKVMGISTAVLPDNSVTISISYQIALMFVNVALQGIPGPQPPYAPEPATDLTIYALAVYNLAGDRLMNFAQDLPGAPTIDGSQPPLAYFAYWRKSFNILGFVSGAITSASDNGTSASYDVPEWAKNLTVSQLANLQTPWGREYLGIAQAYGPSIVGLSRSRCW